MSLTQTFTTAAITASQLRIPVNSTATGFPLVGTAGARQLMWIDNEKMLITGVPVAGMVDVAMRGYDNSVAAPHGTRATVLTSATPADFQSPAPGQFTSPSLTTDDTVTLGADTTVFPANKSVVYYITKPSACAIILDPTLVPDAVSTTITFVSLSAFQHTVTYTPGFSATGTASDVATFAGNVGDTLTVQVQAGGIITTSGLLNVTLS